MPCRDAPCSGRADAPNYASPSLAAQAPRTKHLSGPFFTEGTFTQNSAEEVSELMQAMRDATRMPG